MCLRSIACTSSKSCAKFYWIPVTQQFSSEFLRKFHPNFHDFPEKVSIAENFQETNNYLVAIAMRKCAETLGVWSTHEYNISWEFETHSSTCWKIWDVFVSKILYIYIFFFDFEVIFSELKASKNIFGGSFERSNWQKWIVRRKKPLYRGLDNI